MDNIDYFLWTMIVIYIAARVLEFDKLATAIGAFFLFVLLYPYIRTWFIN